jgi:lysine/ornithine N-monooxygenase
MTVETLIVGAGPAGLAVAACLRRTGHDVAIIERERAVGAAWRRHYERLHLHTVKAHSALPYRSFSGDLPKYVPRARFVEYLEDYARAFSLQPEFGVTVERAAPIEGGWQLQTSAGPRDSRFLVIATGYNRMPHLPNLPGQQNFRGAILIDVGTVALIKAGKIAVRPEVRELTERGVVFADGAAAEYDAIVLATGYLPSLDALLPNAAQVLDGRGLPRRNGCESELAGLFFVGFRSPITGMLRDIAREARQIAAMIASRPA